jgi:hypothetical protein
MYNFNRVEQWQPQKLPQIAGSEIAFQDFFSSIIQVVTEYYSLWTYQLQMCMYMRRLYKYRILFDSITSDIFYRSTRSWAGLGQSRSCNTKQLVISYICIDLPA